jgi:predicted phosphate transport protein (TIGR00153 family)
MNFNLNTVFQALVPKDKKCFPLFRRASENAYEMSVKLHEAFTTDSVSRLQIHGVIFQMEAHGDDISHAIKHESSVNFHVPFDREQVYELANLIDDVCDDIQGISKRVDLYKIHQIPASFSKFSATLVEATHALNRLVHEFQHLRYSNAAKEIIEEIRACEAQADHILEEATAELFATGSLTLDLIKQQEVFTIMARGMKRAEEAASIIESVLVTYN